MHDSDDLADGSSRGDDQFPLVSETFTQIVERRLHTVPPDADDPTTDRSQLMRRFLNLPFRPSAHDQSAQEIDYLFRRFAEIQPMQAGLKLQCGSSSTILLNDCWISVDLDKLEASTLLDLAINLEFHDEQFDRVLCLDLDRVSRPIDLVTELRRVLKRNGQVWAQAPVSSLRYFEPVSGPRYWGFTPDGLRVLFERFDEILCSIYQSSGHVSRKDSFFYGMKPQIPN